MTKQDPTANSARSLAAPSNEEFQALAEAEPVMKKAFEILQRLSADPAVRRLAAYREAQLRRGDTERSDGLDEASAEVRAERESIARDLLVVNLQQRFGALDDAHRRAIEAGTPEQVDRWAARALTVSTVEELLAS